MIAKNQRTVSESAAKAVNGFAIKQHPTLASIIARRVIYSFTARRYPSGNWQICLTQAFIARQMGRNSPGARRRPVHG